MRELEGSSLGKLVVKDKDGCEVHLEKETEKQQIHYSHPPAHSPSAAPIETPKPNEFTSSENTITSPMVGTYYSSPSPEEPPFVKVGDSVTEDTIVCIIEAMKVMNEVKAGKSGVIKKLHLENGHPVEFGTKLFSVE